MKPGDVRGPPPRLGQWPSRDGGRYGEAGSGDLARLPESGGGVGYPISSSVLPFVSLTNRSTNGIESAAKNV